MTKLVEVSIQTVPTFLAATVMVTGHYPDLRREVRAGWARLNALLPVGHPNRIDDETGIVFVPNWNWRIHGQQVLLVGIEVKDVRELTDELIGLHVPERHYATARMKGGEERMLETYAGMNDWMETNGYEMDTSYGVYSFELNPLKPVNPFDIPHEQIKQFDYEIYHAIRPKTAQIGA